MTRYEISILVISQSDFHSVRSKVGLAMICLIQSYPRHFKSDFDYVKSQNLCPWKNFFIFKVKKQHPLNIKIASRTIVARGNNILQVVASFRFLVSDTKFHIPSLG